MGEAQFYVRWTGKESLTTLFQRRPEGGEGASRAPFWGGTCPGSDDRKFKGLAWGRQRGCWSGMITGRCSVIKLFKTVQRCPRHLLPVLLPMVSVTHSPQWSKNIKWKIIEIIHKFQVARPSEQRDEISHCRAFSHAGHQSFLCPAHPRCISHLPNGQFSDPLLQCNITGLF